MEALNLPSFDVIARETGGRTEIFDPFRKKYVPLTPEEWVRQHLVQFLVTYHGVPPGLVAVEAGFRYEGMQRRADLVVHDRAGLPLLVAECKAPSVAISQSTFDQIAQYNTVLKARYLVVTNGVTHFCHEVEEPGVFRFRRTIPTFEEMTAGMHAE